MVAKRLPPSQDELLELFRYDEETGKLYNRTSRSPRAVAQAESGSIYRRGVNAYRIVRLGRRPFKAHRLIWIMKFGNIPEGFEIDHKDRDGLNNCIENLRLATRAKNAKNLPVMKNNTSGITGVVPRKNRWIARIVVEGKYHHLGMFGDLESAIAARKAAEATHGFLTT